MRPRLCRFVLVGALALIQVLPSFADGRQRGSDERLQAYLALVERYRSQPDVAASMIATWTDAEVTQAFMAFSQSPGGPSPTRPERPDVRLAFTAVMLHTDAALRLVAVPSGRADPSVHLQFAMSILRAMARHAPMAGAFPFTPATWHLAVVHQLTGVFHWNIEWSALGVSEGQVHARIEELAEASEHEYAGGAAQMLLAVGSLEESSWQGIASPALREAIEDVRGFAGTMQTRDSSVRHAEALFRQALARDGTLLEARLRLGHLLLDRGRWKEARDELRPALVAARQPADIYLAYLFLGRAVEEGGDAAEAVRLYEKALAAWPGGETARIALASAHEQLGDVDEVRASIEPLVGRAAGATDPWRTYFDGHPGGVRFLDEGRRAIDEMRRRVTGNRPAS